MAGKCPTGKFNTANRPAALKLATRPVSNVSGVITSVDSGEFFGPVVFVLLGLLGAAYES